MSLHNKYIHKICLFCLKYLPSNEKKGKDDIKKKKNLSRPLLDKHESAIKCLIPNYRFEDNQWPKKLCASCYIKFNTNAQQLLITYDYNKIHPLHSQRITRNMKAHANTDDCNCFYCNQVKEYLNIGLNKRASIQNKIITKTKSSPNLCPKCLSRIGQGFSHKCNEKTLAVNVNNIVATNDTVNKRVTRTAIRTKINENKENDFILMDNMHGKATKMYLKQNKLADPLTAEDVSMYETEMNMTGKKSKKLVKNLRKKG